MNGLTRHYWPQPVGRLVIPAVLSATHMPAVSDMIARVMSVSGRSRRNRRQPRTLIAEQRDEVYALMNEERFMDQTPHEICHTPLDEGRYLCSISTMHRILKTHNGSPRSKDNRITQTDLETLHTLGSGWKATSAGSITTITIVAWEATHQSKSLLVDTEK